MTSTWNFPILYGSRRFAPRLYHTLHDHIIYISLFSLDRPSDASIVPRDRPVGHGDTIFQRWRLGKYFSQK